MARESLKDIRRMYDIRVVLGLPPRAKWVVCPLPMHRHSNHTPSFSIFTDNKDGAQRFRCHGNCGLSGDVIDLAGYMWVPGYSPRDRSALARAVQMLTVRSHVSIPMPEPTPTAIDPARWMEYVPIGPAGRAYAHGRGITDEAIEHFRLGQQGVSYLTIPIFRDSALVGIKKRAMRDGLTRFIAEGGSRMRDNLFNYDEVAYATGPVFFVKAEIPAMILWQHGHKACAPCAGEAAKSPWASKLALADITVIGDNDDNGVRFASQRAIDLHARLRFPPAAYKDWDEWYLAEKSECLKETAAWLSN